MVDEDHKKIVGNLLPELESEEISQLLDYSEFRNKAPGNILNQPRDQKTKIFT